MLLRHEIMFLSYIRIMFMFICQHPSSLSESLLGVIATGDQMTCIFILNKIPALCGVEHC